MAVINKGNFNFSYDERTLILEQYCGGSRPIVHGFQITYQYTKNGDLTQWFDWITIPFIGDATPALFRKLYLAKSVETKIYLDWINKFATIRRFKDTAIIENIPDLEERAATMMISTAVQKTPVQSWDRLVELSRESLERDPDQKFIVANAWLCGIHPDGGKYIAECRQKLAENEGKINAVIDGWREIAAREKGLDERFDLQVVDRGHLPGEGGQEPWAVVQVQDKETSEVLVFRCQNVFDVGFVTSPSKAELSDEQQLLWDYLKLRSPISTKVEM